MFLKYWKKVLLAIEFSRFLHSLVYVIDGATLVNNIEWQTLDMCIICVAKRVYWRVDEQIHSLVYMQMLSLFGRWTCIRSASTVKKAKAELNW